MRFLKKSVILLPLIAVSLFWSLSDTALGVTRQFGELESVGDIKVPSNSSYGFSFLKNGKWIVRVNDVEYGPYDAYTQGSLMFSQDGESFGFFLTNNTKQYVNINGREF